MGGLHIFWRTQGGLCFYCGRETYLPMEPKAQRKARLGSEGMNPKRRASLEHLQRRKDGGTACFDNLVMACTGCNSSRGDKAPLLHLADMRASV